MIHSTRADIITIIHSMRVGIIIIILIHCCVLTLYVVAAQGVVVETIRWRMERCYNYLWLDCSQRKQLVQLTGLSWAGPSDTIRLLTGLHKVTIWTGHVHFVSVYRVICSCMCF